MATASTPTDMAELYFGNPTNANTVLAELDAILADLPAFTASGRKTNAMTSNATLPRTPLAEIPQRLGTPLQVPDWLSNYSPNATTTAKDIRSARQLAMISDLLDNVGSLDLPPTAVPQPTAPRPQNSPRPVPTNGRAGIIGVLIDLLTYSGDTNSNEKDKLTEKQGPAYTNKPEYEKLLQQALQQLQSGGGKP